MVQRAVKNPKFKDFSKPYRHQNYRPKIFCDYEESFKKFLDLHDEADDFQQI